MRESLEDISPFNSFKILRWVDKLFPEEWSPAPIPKPVTLTFDLANLCNHDCLWCFNRAYRMRKPERLKTEAVETVVDDIEGSEIIAIEFTGGGEPTLHPDLAKILRLCKRHDLTPALVSNGELLDGNKAQAAIECCDWIRISLDAGSPKTYRELHGSSHFDVVLRNLGALVKLRGEREKPMIGVTYLVHPANAGEITATAKMLDKIGADYLNFRPLFYDYEGVRDRLNFSSIDMRKDAVIQNSIRDCQELMGNMKVRATWHRYSGEPMIKRFKKCYCTPLNGLIRADGVMQECCERRGEEGLEYGSIYKEDFWELWYSDEHEKILAGIDVRDCPNKCKLSKMNEIIEHGVVHDGLGLRWI